MIFNSTLFFFLQSFAHSDFLGDCPDPHLGLNGKEDSENSIAITRLFFVPGRTSAAAATGEILKTKYELCNLYWAYTVCRL